MEFGEPPPDGALRELAEETGLAGEILGLAEIQDSSGRWTHPVDGVDEAYHNILLIFHVEITGGELHDEADGSTDAARWFTRAEAAALPLVDLARTGIRLAFDE